MNEELNILDLKTRLGLGTAAVPSLEDQLEWAARLQSEQPMSPWRLRAYHLLTDHDIQREWLGWETGTLSQLLEHLDRDQLREEFGGEKLEEYLVDLGGWHEPGASINYWLQRASIMERTVGFGSRNPYHQPSMTSAECRSAFDKGRRLAEWEALKGSLWAGVRLMNPSTCIFAAMQLYIHASVRLEESLKPLLDKDRIEAVVYVAQKALRRHPMSRDAFTSLTFFGGYDLAFLTGFIAGMASEGRFTLVGGLEGFAAAYLAELIQPGSAQYITAIQSAPSSWTEENGEAFDLPAVFTSRSHSPSLSGQRLALFHLHSSLPFSQMP